MNCFNYQTGSVLKSYQYPLDEHVVVLLCQLRSTQHKPSQQLNRCFPHTGGVIHQPPMNTALHIRLHKTNIPIKRYEQSTLTELSIVLCCQF